MSLTEIHLSLLMNGHCHGYEIKHAHDRMFLNEPPIAYGQVYASLARLVRDGYACVSETPGTRGPRRQVHAITESGRQRLLDWLTSPTLSAGTSSESSIRKVLAALAAGGVGPALAFVHAQQAYLQEKSSLEIRKQRTSLSTAASIGELTQYLARRHQAIHMGAELQWLDDASRALHSVGTSAHEKD